MVVRTYFNKNNTLIANETINTGQNPVTELFYGGTDDETKYSRYIFNFDTSRLVALYTGGTYPDLTKLTHTLRLTNTGSFSKLLLNGTYGGKERTSSFDLIAFRINQDWDEGVGYDFASCGLLVGDCATSTNPSNWSYAKTAVSWANGFGVYTGSPASITVATQHFDAGNENIEMDITSYINGILTGGTNYGLGLAYAYAYEQMNTSCLQYVGFFTRHTQTFYEPFIETVYNNHIADDRPNFFLDKANKLYLYVNLAGTPTNLDTTPTVTIYDQEGEVFSASTATSVTHVTKGVYSINITVPTTTAITEGYLFTDVWSGITINGVSRPAITLDFELRNSLEYYNIGNADSLPRNVAVSVSGIHSGEKVFSGDVRKVLVSARIPYTVNQRQKIASMSYRLYVKEGKNELSVIDYQPVESTSNDYYFLIDTASLLPNDYFLDVKVETNQEIITKTQALTFTVVSKSDLRNSQ